MNVLAEFAQPREPLVNRAPPRSKAVVSVRVSRRLVAKTLPGRG